MKSSVLRFAFRIVLVGVGLQLYPQALAVTVTNLNDSGPGSIRQVIADTPVGGTIDFAVTGNIVLASGQLVIAKDLTINGPGATNLTLSQNSTSRILVVSNGNVNISDLTIANGNCVGAYDDGGGIKNLATLTLRNCRIKSNFAINFGGGVFNQGNLIVRDSLITSNTAFNPAGGILNVGTVTIIGSTICNNKSISADWLPVGGILNYGSLMVSNSTVSGNQGIWRRAFLGHDRRLQQHGGEQSAWGPWPRNQRPQTRDHPQQHHHLLLRMAHHV